MTTKTKPAATAAAPVTDTITEKPVHAPALADAVNLPAIAGEYGIDAVTWQTLTDSIYPGAKPASILSAVAYCRARGLDVLKKPVHIVPMRVSVKTPDGKSRDEWRDVIMPGINELRTTAMRSGEYLGHSKPEFGPIVDVYGIAAPEWCEITVYRMIRGLRTEFPNREYFREACATKKDHDSGRVSLNAMWARRPIGQLVKCALAGALRDAFPEETGNQYAAEEMHGKVIDVESQTIEDENGATPGADVGEAGPLSDEAINSRVSQSAATAKPRAQTEADPDATKDWPTGENAGREAAAAVADKRAAETFDDGEAPAAAGDGKPEASGPKLADVMALIEAGLATKEAREKVAAMVNSLSDSAERMQAGRAMARAIAAASRAQASQ